MKVDKFFNSFSRATLLLMSSLMKYINVCLICMFIPFPSGLRTQRRYKLSEKWIITRWSRNHLENRLSVPFIMSMTVRKIFRIKRKWNRNIFSITNHSNKHLCLQRRKFWNFLFLKQNYFECHFSSWIFHWVENSNEEQSFERVSLMLNVVILLWQYILVFTKLLSDRTFENDPRGGHDVSIKHK